LAPQRTLRGHEFDEDTVVAPADMHAIYQFATKCMMPHDDAELQDPIITEAEAQINDSYCMDSQN